MKLFISMKNYQLQPITTQNYRVTCRWSCREILTAIHRKAFLKKWQQPFGIWSNDKVNIWFGATHFHKAGLYENLHWKGHRFEWQYQDGCIANWQCKTSDTCRHVTAKFNGCANLSTRQKTTGTRCYSCASNTSFTATSVAETSCKILLPSFCSYTHPKNTTQR